ncbi:MAG: transposase [Chloroflexi bacterium]|nr:transposase [Chloroflexota bacterium]
MTKPSADLAPLVAFRQQVYAALDHRQESLFELIDGVLSTPEPTALVRFSLSPAFRRRWPSACDALADGSLDPVALRTLFQQHLPPPAAGERPVWVLDGTTWPRPAAATSPARTDGQVSSKGTPSSTIVAVWEYQWLVALPEPTAGGSWALPLDVQRRGPTAPTPTQLAIQQLRCARAPQPAGTPRPVAALDSGYHAHELAAAPSPDFCSSWAPRPAHPSRGEKSPGRRPGQCPGPRLRFTAAKRTHPLAA